MAGAGGGPWYDCWQEFCDTEHDDDGRRSLTEGYVTADDHDPWICPQCFEDFKDRFRAVLVEALQTLVRERVGTHAWPREVEFVANLPRTESGKIQRALPRRRAVEGGGRDGGEEP